ncbi:branched-chain alpha-ketoacid dehydrogenase [Blastocladiella britannica]|nr:branched-chain alpha-ketoacid dehydrogenase [Blastocladiella britannica]
MRRARPATAVLTTLRSLSSIAYHQVGPNLASPSSIPPPPPLSAPSFAPPGAGLTARLTPAISDLCRRTLTPVTLPDLLKIGRAATPTRNDSADAAAARAHARIANAHFLLSELPVRLARRCQAFAALPMIVAINPHMQHVYQLYLESLAQLLAFPRIDSEADERKFARELGLLVEAHKDVISTVSQGFLECRQYMTPAEIGAFLDKLISARIGVRVLAEHHLALHDPHPSFIGIVDTALNPAKLARRVFDYLEEVAVLHYGVCPEFVIDGHPDTTTMAYIPVHLEYILSELLKNSVRATVEHHVPPSARGVLGAGADDSFKLPPVRLTVSAAADEVVLRLRDAGGGIPYESLQKAFEYSYTTVAKRTPDAALKTPSGADGMSLMGDTAELGMQQAIGGPIAGLGYGLGTARVYARYFGGSLRMVSLYGHGCDVYLRLPNIDRAARNVQI